MLLRAELTSQPPGLEPVPVQEAAPGLGNGRWLYILIISFIFHSGQCLAQDKLEAQASQSPAPVPCLQSSRRSLPAPTGSALSRVLQTFLGQLPKQRSMNLSPSQSPHSGVFRDPSPDGREISASLGSGPCSVD